MALSNRHRAFFDRMEALTREKEDRRKLENDYPRKDEAIWQDIIDEANKLGYNISYTYEISSIKNPNIIKCYKKHIDALTKNLVSCIDRDELRLLKNLRHSLISISIAQSEYKIATGWCLEEFLKAPATKVTGDFTILGIKYDWAEAIEKQQNPEFLNEYLKILKDKKHIIDSFPIERLYKKLAGSLPKGLEEKRKKWEEEAKRKGAKNPIPEEYQAIAQRAREKYPNRGKNSKKEK